MAGGDRRPPLQDVVDAGRCTAEPLGDAGVVRRLVPEAAGSALALDRIELSAGASLALPAAPEADLLVYVLAGTGTWTAGRRTVAVAPGDALWRHRDDEPVTVSAGGEPLWLARARAGAGCDEHAALGEREPVSHLDLVGDGQSATGRRSFQVLLGPDTGCCRATLFVGAVPPGAAPWHFHQYDEIIYVLDGHGTYHQARGSQATQAGCAVRIPPRTVHINENGAPDTMLVLGLFTPAGSPSAAFLAADPTG